MKLALLVLLFTSSAFAAAELPVAICNVQNSVADITPVQSYKIFVTGDIYSPESASVEFSKTRVSAQFGFYTWTTFIARFTEDGSETTLQFPQVMSPSFGILKTASGERQVACVFSKTGVMP